MTQQLYSQQQINAGTSSLIYTPSAPSDGSSPASPPSAPQPTPAWVPWAVGAAVGGVVLFLVLRD